MTTLIYALKEPDTGEIRYIGKSNDPKRRFRSHLFNSGLAKDHRSCWIRSLLSAGKKPSLEILDEIPYDLWESAEMGYIHFYRSLGRDLVNTASGGETGPGLSGEKHPMFRRPVSQETREKLAAYCGPKASFYGRTHSLETREKQAAAHRGRKHSQEHRENNAKAQRGTKQTPEHIKNKVAATVGKKRGPYKKKGRV